MALKVENRILLVKAYPQDEKATKFTGYLTQVPSEVQTKLIDPIKDQKIKDLFFPSLLNADNDFRGSGYFGLGVSAIFLAIGGWNVLKVMRRQGKLELHPVWKKLAQFGQPDVLASEINSQIADDTHNFHSGKNIILTKSWLIHRATYSLNISNLEHIAWIYQKVTQHRTNGIPTGKTYAAIIVEQNGETVEIPAKEAEVLKILAEIVQRIPWVVVGYSDDIKNLWQKDQESFLAVLQQRREQVNHPSQN